MEDHFNGLPGFKSHYLYDDFSTPCFDGRHTMMQVYNPTCIIYASIYITYSSICIIYVSICIFYASICNIYSSNCIIYVSICIFMHPFVLYMYLFVSYMYPFAVYYYRVDPGFQQVMKLHVLPVLHFDDTFINTWVFVWSDL